ncbi:MAG: M14 family metallopeptidase [Candidatus Aminicenantes bacterium]|nr:M14 family metallopeptidase [Candidatus Aminicenantes bacterium]
MKWKRKNLTWIAAPFLAAACASAGFALQPQSEPGAVEEKGAETYRVGGKRDGPSFFPRVHYPEVEPLKEGELDFRHYPTYGEIHGFLRKWAREYPQILELYSVGRSFEGREIWQVTVTNRETGNDTDKPAMFAEGGRHSGETASSVSIVQLIHLLVTSYGKDPEITHLVDTKAFYLRPVNNPDGAELFLLTAQTNRSSVRPHDTDRDGLLDEEPGEDLDGDGFLLQMRRHVGEGKGNAIRDPRDPDRLMKMVPEGEGDWQVDPEGVDNDGDGKFNEDGIGGLDLHRNYPENWRPEPGRDATERGFTQVGAGEYPLSEPETRAVVLFLLTHPNVAIGQSMDTPMAMHLRPPSTSRSQESMAPEDLKWYVYLDKQAKAISGYPWAGDVYEDYRNVHPFHVITGEPSRPIPLFGHGPDFGYSYFGSIWYNDELWNIGRQEDYDGDGRLDDYDALVWNDRERGGKEFIPWKKIPHPQLGEVEIGGFTPKFAFWNPPVDLLEEWASKSTRFNLFLAKQLPQVRISRVRVRPLAPGDYSIELTYRNVGHLPTALVQARLVKIVKPDTARIEFDDELVESGQVRVLEPSLRSKDIEAGWLDPAENRTVAWKVRLKDVESVEAEVSIHSTRGGVDRRKVRIPAGIE